MALIKCTECGHELSEKATCCPKCGCPIDTIITTNNDIKQELKKDKIKKISKILLIVLVVCLLIFSLVKFFTREDSSGLYDKNEWGTSLENIQEKYPDGSLGKDKDDENIIEYSITQHNFKGLEGIEAFVVFRFKENALDNISVVTLTSDDAKSNVISLKDTLLDKYTDIYGKHEAPDSSSYEWTTKKSQITLINLMEDLCMIKYKAIDKL